MKTVEIKLYKFNELEEDAKNKAIEKYRDSDQDYSYLYDEAHESVKEFHSIFNTSEGRKSWLDSRCDNIDNIDNNVLDLKGLRLRTYIINNFSDNLYKGKYFKSWMSDKQVKHRKVKSKIINEKTGWTNKEIFGKYWNQYYGIKKENSCVLTGVCWDDSLLQPVYDFIENYKEHKDYNSYLDFETLISDCLSSLEKDLESEVESRNKDSYIIEELEANDYDFTENGEIY